MSNREFFRLMRAADEQAMMSALVALTSGVSDWAANTAGSPIRFVEDAHKAHLLAEKLQELIGRQAQEPDWQEERI